MIDVQSPARQTFEPCSGRVVAVCASSVHGFSKTCLSRIRLNAGVGVEGDAHAGITVQHRSRVAVDPTQPNLRQVHLVASELHAELHRKGFLVEPGTIGENIATAGIDLLALPADTLLRVGTDAVIRVTGLRNPCTQLDAFQRGLTAAVLDRDDDGNLLRKAGIMGIVVASGIVKPGDTIARELPQQPHRRLERV